MNITYDDPRLTAYALGELDDAGRSVIETEMRNFDECRCEIEEITSAAALVRSELASEPALALTPVQQRAIEAKIKLSGSRPKLSWIPSAENWGLSNWRPRKGLVMLNTLQICLVTFPMVMPEAILAFFQNASIDMAYALIKMAGPTVVKHGLELTFPSYGATLRLAPECSRISSSMVLLLGSLLLGMLYLRSPWKRVLLTLFVVPLVIVRDGFRIFTIVEFFVQMGAHRMGSPIFLLGTPIFFALSLIPFLLFLVWLRKLELKASN